MKVSVINLKFISLQPFIYPALSRGKIGIYTLKKAHITWHQSLGHLLSLQHLDTLL